jgi:serine/threonine-protein phosphatase 2B catalytic subunit
MYYPNSFFLLRGNHECRQLTAFFNFKDECSYKYNIELYDSIMAAFDFLPLAAIINNQFFCVHGGLSPDIRSLEEISLLDRCKEIPREGPMCDLLWSDPFEEEGKPADDRDETDEEGNQEDSSWFGYNDQRQCSYVYGVAAVNQFLQENKLTSIIRAHEAQIQGYKMQMVNADSGIPRVITIFSAPNYCDIYNNKAACLKFDQNVLNIKQFIDSPHPYYLPKFMDVFQWSLPFVAEKVCDMLATVLRLGEDDSSGDDDENVFTSTEPPIAMKDVKDSPQAVELKSTENDKLKQKAVAVTKIMNMYKTLREEHESIVHLRELSPGKRISLGGGLQAGSEAIQQAVKIFENAREADAENEIYPVVPRGHRPTASDSRMYEIQKILSPRRRQYKSRASM